MPKPLEREDIIRQLQEKGIDVNPRARTKTLLDALAGSVASAPTARIDSVADIPLQDNENADMKQLLKMMGQVVNKVDSMDKRLTSVETNGKGDFKLSVKEEDVENATKSKSGVDERIIRIVEDVLGVDFGVEVMPNPNGPGFQFSVLVPERLSEVKRSSRPIIDTETGKYKLGPDNKVIEEEYWPGDRRSRAIGSTDSFDVIRDQCQRVRSYIVSFYEKNKRPLPEFRLK